MHRHWVPNHHVPYIIFRYLVSRCFLEAGSPLPYLEWILHFLGDSWLFYTPCSYWFWNRKNRDISKAPAQLAWALLARRQLLCQWSLGIKILGQQLSFGKSTEGPLCDSFAKYDCNIKSPTPSVTTGDCMKIRKINFYLPFAYWENFGENAWTRMPSGLRHQNKKKNKKGCHFQDLPCVSIAKNDQQQEAFFPLIWS